MGKYAALGTYLLHQGLTEVPMTFAEIENVTGAALPPTAGQHRAWWSNNPSNNVMTKVWLEAGFVSEQVDLTGRKLIFRRNEPVARSRSASPAPISAPPRHPAFGALKGLMRIAPETDLTEPADPQWGQAI